jgi:CelD/BcsL family acetyltransferase involved in cellulose biosynthesis
MNGAEEIRLVRPAELAADEIAAWRQLLTTHDQLRNAFLSRSFVEAVAGVNPGVRVAVCRRGGKPLAFLPVQKRAGFSGWFGVYERVGGEICDCFGLIAAPEYQIDITAWLERCGIGTLVFSHLEQKQLQHGLRGEAPRIGLRTRFNEPGATFWARLREQKKGLARDTERRQRKLELEHGPLKFELQSADPHHDLDALIALKQAQYRRTGRRSPALFNARTGALLHALLESRAEECAGLLSVLRVETETGSRVVSAHFGLRCHDTLHFWFPAYDPQFSAYAPGRILLRHVIEVGAAGGLRCIDRGEGDNPAKRDFSNEEHLFYSGVWMRRAATAWPARIALSAEWRMGSAMRGVVRPTHGAVTGPR